MSSRDSQNADRPKCSVYVPVKMPAELHAAIREQCARYPIGHRPSIAEWIRTACEARLEVIFGHRLGFYRLYTEPGLIS